MFYAFSEPGKRCRVAGLLSDVLGLFLGHVVLLEDPGQEQDETSPVPTFFRPAVGQTTTVSTITDDRNVLLYRRKTDCFEDGTELDFFKEYRGDKKKKEIQWKKKEKGIARKRKESRVKKKEK